MEFRKIKDIEMEDAIKLVWDVFSKYVAPDYSKEGILEFEKTIHNKDWICEKDFYVAIEDNKIYGVIAVKDKHHIALFFVDGEKHGLGIGKNLYNLAKKFNPDDYFTVNSSPYAKDIYKSLGFKENGSEECVHGIRFIPMKAMLDKA